MLAASSPPLSKRKPSTENLSAVSVQASPSSVTFYERRGYVAQRTDRLFIGDAVFDFTLMRRALDQ